MTHEQAPNPSRETQNGFSIQAVIFDYDGLLVDTEDIHFEAAKIACANFGIVLDETHREILMQRGGLVMLLNEHFNFSGSIEEVRGKRKEAFIALTSSGISPMEGAIEAVNRLSVDFRLAIGSMLSTSDIFPVLDGLGIREKFEVVIGGNDVMGKKPEPDVFLKVADVMGLKPHQCIVLEDSLRGVEAAQRAGMISIAVPNKFLINRDFSKATYVAQSLNNVNLSLISTLSTY